LTTLLSQIFLESVNQDPLITYAIWKYQTPKEGDGRLHLIKDAGKFKIINRFSNDTENIDLEQVYVGSDQSGTTTKAMVNKLGLKNNDPKSDRNGETLCVFVERNSLDEGGIIIEEIKEFLQKYPLIFDFYFVITLRGSKYLDYYVYELVDLDPNTTRHHRIVIRLEPKRGKFEFFDSEEKYLSKFNKW
jgi:hypothetical protein